MANEERPESGERIDPKEVLKQMAKVLGSEKARDVFAQLQGTSREDVISRLSALVTEWVKLHRKLTNEEEQKERERLGLEFSYSEVLHPEMVIARVLRDGRYLDSFRMQDPDIARRLPGKILRHVEVYRQHVEKFGKDSIAHLCLDGSLFFDLTDGLQLGWLNPEVLRINTVEELRTFLARLSADESVRFVRTDDHFKRMKEALGATNYLGRDVHKGHMIDKIQSKLAEWDAIPEELPNSSVST